MNVKKLFLMMAAVSGALALCQCSSEAPPPPGTVRMVDQQAIALMQELSLIHISEPTRPY